MKGLITKKTTIADAPAVIFLLPFFPELWFPKPDFAPAGMSR
jgi:hypothetical protein